MKRLLLYISSLLFICSLFTSCKPKIKQCAGVVTSIKNDTLKMKIANDSALFILDKATFDNGAVAINDSAEVSYMGSLSEGHAVLVRLIAPKSHIINIETDTTKVIKTKPASKKDVENLSKAVKLEKEYLQNKKK
jgi:hypothetical protein